MFWKYKATVLSLASALLGFSCGAASSEPTDPTGRELYQGLAMFSNGPNATSLKLPQEFAACANCHGTHGLGSPEAAGAVPPLLWSKLTQSRNGRPGFASVSDVALAITQGRGRDGLPLSSAMPRYDLTAPEARALTDYLKVIGSADDVARGVSRDSIRLGVLVPLSGPMIKIGVALREGVQASFDRVNKSSGIFGRKLELVAINSSAPSDQIIRSIEIQDVYGVVGSLWWQDDDLESFLARSHISAIASITPVQTTGSVNPWSFSLIASREDQSKSLASALEKCPDGRPVWILGNMDSELVDSKPEFRRFSTSAALLAALPTAPQAGCIGLSLGHLQFLDEEAGVAWKKIVVLPFPANVLQSGPDVWQTLGQAAGAIAIELLGNAGQALDERALLERLSSLNGFEPLPGLPIKTNGKPASAFQADVLVFDVQQMTADALPKPH